MIVMMELSFLSFPLYHIFAPFMIDRSVVGTPRRRNEKKKRRGTTRRTGNDGVNVMVVNVLLPLDCIASHQFPEPVVVLGFLSRFIFEATDEKIQKEENDNDKEVVAVQIYPRRGNGRRLLFCFAIGIVFIDIAPLQL